METQIVIFPLTMNADSPANKIGNPIKDSAFCLSYLDYWANVAVLLPGVSPYDANMAIGVNKPREPSRFSFRNHRHINTPFGSKRIIRIIR